MGKRRWFISHGFVFSSFLFFKCWRVSAFFYLLFWNVEKTNYSFFVIEMLKRFFFCWNIEEFQLFSFLEMFKSFGFFFFFFFEMLKSFFLNVEEFWFCLCSLLKNFVFVLKCLRVSPFFQMLKNSAFFKVSFVKCWRVLASNSIFGAKAACWLKQYISTSKTF